LALHLATVSSALTLQLGTVNNKLALQSCRKIALGPHQWQEHLSGDRELFRMAPRGRVQTLTQRTQERRWASCRCVGRGKCRSMKMRVSEAERTCVGAHGKGQGVIRGPKYAWDIVVGHCNLINAVTQSCPTDSSVTIYEAESGMIPDLDKILPLGYQVSWQARSQRFQSLTQESSWYISRVRYLEELWIFFFDWLVVAKESMDFIHDCSPLKEEPSSNSEYA